MEGWSVERGEWYDRTITGMDTASLMLLCICTEERLTLVFNIGQCRRQDLERTNEVEGIHVMVKGEENADRLCLSALFTDCTHRDGIVGKCLL